MKDQLTELYVDVVPDGAGATVVLAGEIDLATAPELQARLESLIDATTGDVALDVARVTFLDSTGLHVIALVHRRLRDACRQLRVQPIERTRRRVLELSGMARLLEVERRSPAADTPA